MDEDLDALQRLAAGEEQALSELMGRYREPIFRLCWRYSANAADAQELTEETFVRVFFNAVRFKPRATVKTWIFTIAANLCRDFLRRRKKHRLVRSMFEPRFEPEGRTLEDTLIEPTQDAAASTAGSEQVEEIRTAIQQLPEKLRFPFVFCVLEEHSYEEAAAVLGLSAKAVEMRIYRARKALQVSLTD